MKCNAGIMEIFMAEWSELQFNNLTFPGSSVPNRINKASLPPNLHRLLSAILNQTIKFDGSCQTMSCVIYIVQIGDYISPVGHQKVT